MKTFPAGMELKVTWESPQEFALWFHRGFVPLLKWVPRHEDVYMA